MQNFPWAIQVLQQTETFFIKEGTAVASATDRITQIVEPKYERADLKEIVQSQDQLTQAEQQSLLVLLQKYESLFDGTLGKWEESAYNIELKPNATPYHGAPYSIPQAYEKIVRRDVDRLVAANVLKKVNRSEWAAPSFIIPKKDGSVRFISDFRELNKRIRRKPFPIPKIQGMLLKLEGFQYATSLDLNMG